MMETKTKEPKFQIGDIVCRHFKHGNTETKEISKILFINHDHILNTDVILYGIFGHNPNNGSFTQLVNENDLTLVRKWHDNIEPKEQSEWHFSQAVKVEEMSLAFINVAVRCGLIPNYPSTHGPDEIVIDKEWLDEIIAFLNNKVLSDIVEGHFECKSMDDIKFYDSHIPVPVTPIIDLSHLVNKILPSAIRRVISTKCATCGYDPARHESNQISSITKVIDECLLKYNGKQITCDLVDQIADDLTHQLLKLFKDPTSKIQKCIETFVRMYTSLIYDSDAAFNHKTGNSVRQLSEQIRGLLIKHNL